MPGFLKFVFTLYISQLYRVMRFQIHHSTTSCLPNTCIILHMMAKLKIFVTFFSGTTMPRFLKFGFRLNVSQTYRVMRFQIHHSTTSCLPDTCINLHMMAKLKIIVVLFSGTTMPGFLKFGIKLYISQPYRVMRFQIHHVTTSCLPNTCIILHMMARLKSFVTFFSGTTMPGFLKLCFTLFISQL